jgi:type IV pilus assembly protein PilW
LNTSSARRFPRLRRTRRIAGLTLVELMVSLVLGLLVVGGAITVFVSNSQTYRATESLGRIQESGRVAFELMARDLRESGGNACERDLPVRNVLNNAGTDWWSTWGAAVTGYDGATAFPGGGFGTGFGARIAGTDGIEIKSAVSNGVTVDDHQPTSAQFKVNTVNHGLDDGDIVMVCDFNHAAIFQITNASPGTNETVVHNIGTGVPGNSSKCLSLDGLCDDSESAAVKTYAFGCFGGQMSGGACVDPRNWPANIAKLQAWRWYIGNNGRGGRSLFRTGLRNASGTLSATPIEVAENVTDLDVRYLATGATSYAAAGTITDWTTVIAVRLTLEVVGEENIASDGGRLVRRLQHTVALRNRTE